QIPQEGHIALTVEPLGLPIHQYFDHDVSAIIHVRDRKRLRLLGFIAQPRCAHLGQSTSQRPDVQVEVQVGDLAAILNAGIWKCSSTSEKRHWWMPSDACLRTRLRSYPRWRSD